MRPAGKYLMEDFYYAGGLRGLLERMRDLLDLGAMTCQRPHARREHRRRARSTTTT
jgi:dihydroxyacid dehydratase/phosphogluconate dehydratase